MRVNGSSLLVTLLLACSAAPGIRANQITLPGSVQVSSVGRARDPAAAFNSVDRTWLVVWIESDAALPQNGQILGRIVREDRSFVGAAFTIGGGVALVRPRVAHEPLRNEWMVVYGAGPTFEPGPLRIIARKVTAAGALVGTADVLLSAGNLGETGCDVAAARSVNNVVPGPPTPYFMAVWQQNFGAHPGIVALRLFDDANSPSRINFSGSPFQLDIDPSLPGGRNSTRPRITELAPTSVGSGVGGANRSETFHRVVFEVETDGQKDIYLVGMNLTTVRSTVRITQTPSPSIEGAPVVAYNPVTLRTMVLFERSGSGVRGQLLGVGETGSLLDLLGGDFEVSTGIVPAVAQQAGTDSFFASAEDATRLGLGCIAGRRVIGTPSVGTGTGSTQPVLSPSTAGLLLLGFLRSNADGTKVIRASILVDPPPAIGNTAPIARAGSDLEVAEGTLFNLDGTASSDADGDPLRWQWSRTGAGNAEDFFIASPERFKSNPRLQAPMLGQDLQPITLTYQLAMDDFRLSPAFGPTDTVAVRVLPGADLNPPVARAGADRSVDESQGVQLDGSASSDADGDPLTFSWTVTSVVPPVIAPASVVLAGASSALASFTAPRFGQPGGIDIVLRLVVTTPRGGQGVDEVVIHVRDSINEPPVADAGANATIDEAALFQLNGAASADPNGDALTFLWEVTSTLSFIGNVKEKVDISDVSSPTPTVIAQIFSERDIQLRLTVRDPAGAEDTDELVLRVRTVPMRVTTITPMEGSPGTRVTIRGVNLFDPGTRVFFNGNDLTRQGIIESIDDTQIVVLVPSGGPSHLRALPINSKMGGMVAIDYRDVTTGPVTVRKGNEMIASALPFVISHLEIFDAYLSQGMEAYPLVRRKDTLLQLRVRVAPGPQSPLPNLTDVTCTVFPSDGSGGWQVEHRRVPRAALAATANVTKMDEAVNLFLDGPRVTAPAYRFDARLYHNGVEVAGFRTDADSAPFTPTGSIRMLAVKIVPFKNGSVDPAFAADRPVMQANIDNALLAFRRMYPIPDAELVFWPDEVEMSQIIQDDGKVHLEAFGFTKNALIHQVGAYNRLVDIQDSWNNLHPDQKATVVVGFVAKSLYATGTASGIAVPPKEMMGDIIRLVITKDIGLVGDILNTVFGLLEDALCGATFGLYCKDPIDVLLDSIFATLAVGTPYDVTGKISLVIANSTAGATLVQEVGHNLGLVNPNDPEHDDDNISHSKYDEDTNELTFLSAPRVSAPIFNVVWGEQNLFHSSNLPKSVMSYAQGDTNQNSFFEPSEYTRVFNAYRVGGTGAAAGLAHADGGGAADGPALHLSGYYALGAAALAVSEVRSALPSEPLSVNPATSLLTLAFLDAGRRVLAERPMSFNMTLPIHGHGDDGSDDFDGDVFLFFTVTHAIPAGTATAELRYRGTPLWSRSAQGAAPQVEISFPRGGETVAPGDEVVVRWIALDADGDDLTHSLFLSLDGGATFDPLAVTLRGTQHRWATAAAAGSERAVLKVVSSDGFHSAESLSGAFRLGGGALSAAILAPAAGAKIVSSQPLACTGSARAPGGVEVTDDAAFRWTLVGAAPGESLGAGRRLIVSPLAAGPWRVRLEVQSGGQTASAELDLNILLDTDGDGVDDDTERAAGLDPNNLEDIFLDSDGDGLADGAEILDFGTNPAVADTDGDGVPDGEEAQSHTSPTRIDTDADGVRDDTDNCPLVANADQADSDQDGVGDACPIGSEVAPAQLRRGDSNRDGKVNISDPTSTLNYLFQGGQDLRCLDAGDANDDGKLDISDAVTTLSFLFLGGVAIPAPGPSSCGPDPTEDLLGCAESGGCP